MLVSVGFWKQVLMPSDREHSFEAHRDGPHWHCAIMDYASVRMWIMGAPSSAQPMMWTRILWGARISWLLEASSDAQRPRAQLRSTSRWISLAYNMQKMYSKVSEWLAHIMVGKRRSASALSRASVSSSLPFHVCRSVFGGRTVGPQALGKARRLTLWKKLKHAYASRRGGSH